MSAAQITKGIAFAFASISSRGTAIPKLATPLLGAGHWGASRESDGHPPVKPGNSRHQTFRIGVPRLTQHIARTPEFYQTSCVHDADMVREKASQSEIVGHNNLRYTAFHAQLLQFTGDLQLDRGVQCAGRLVAEQDLLT